MKGSNKYGLKFTRVQRNGIFVLVLLLVMMQFLIYFTGRLSLPDISDPEAEKWLAQQTVIDSLKQLKQKSEKNIESFNPNFISDYKGYRLGMTVAEIDRLQAFRAQGNFVNSVSDFRKVTGMEEKRLSEIAPFFKFPEWVNQKKNKGKEQLNQAEKKVKTLLKIDINDATKTELMAVYGIGEALSERILKEKEKFGAFVSTAQFRYIWGLSDEVVEKLIQHFPVINPPVIVKIDINNASLKELTRFPYFRYALAKEIITYRSMNGSIKSKEDLTKIKEFPVEKVDIIALYLDF